MSRVPALASYNEYSNLARRRFPVDHRVGKVLEWVLSTIITCRSAQTWELNEEFSHALELCEKPAGQPGPAFSAVEARCLKQICFRSAVKRVTHVTCALTRASAAAPSTRTLGSASASLSRLAATASQ